VLTGARFQDNDLRAATFTDAALDKASIRDNAVWNLRGSPLQSTVLSRNNDFSELADGTDLSDRNPFVSAV
jgi:uncharacterized protein YjbI with pentapeptide repeats